MLGLTTYLSQIFVTWGLQIERAGPATTVTLIGVPSTMILQVIFLHKEPLSWLSIVGALVICFSIGNVALTKAIFKSSAQGEEIVAVKKGQNVPLLPSGSDNQHDYVRMKEP